MIDADRQALLSQFLEAGKEIDRLRLKRHRMAIKIGVEGDPALKVEDIRVSQDSDRPTPCPGLVDARGLKRRLRFSVSAVWFIGEAEAGRLPCLRVGKRLLFNVEAVERALLKLASSTTIGTKAAEE